MPFKLRMVLIAILPLLFVSAVVAWLSFNEMQSLSDEQLKLIRSRLLETKQHALKDMTDLALTTIEPILKNPNLDEKTAQKEVKRVLNSLGFGRDGYFFVYDNHGVNLVHPIQTDLVGKNLYFTKDSQGDNVVKELLKIAAEGGGFHQYYWNKPSTQTEVKKLAYVVQLPRWNWMLGTGLYMDDISQEEESIRKQVEENIKHNMYLIVGIVIFTTLGITLLMMFVNLRESRLADRRLRGLAQNFVKLQIQERRQFSRELHDGINQLMIAIKFKIEYAINKIKKTKENGVELESLTAGLHMLTQAIKEVRRISHALRPGLLDRMGLTTAIRDLLDQFQERTGIIVTAKLFPNQKPHFTENIDITLYRVIQEALTNIERHANASSVNLELTHNATSIQLELLDNGRGFTLEEPTVTAKAGIGLTNMRERVELLDGEFHIESMPGRGTRIRVTLPINPGLR